MTVFCELLIFRVFVILYIMHFVVKINQFINKYIVIRLNSLNKTSVTIFCVYSSFKMAYSVYFFTM
jgi:hypothetical protein